MKPIWIKYYGLVPMTRRGYLITLYVSGVLALVVVVAGLLTGFLPPLSSLWDPDPVIAQQGLGGWLYNHLYWLFLFCLVM